MTILPCARSDAEEESESEDEEDGFGPSKKVEQDPMDREYHSSCRVSCHGNNQCNCLYRFICIYYLYNKAINCVDNCN